MILHSRFFATSDHAKRTENDYFGRGTSFPSCLTRGKNGGAINNLFPYGVPLSPGDNRFAISPSRGCHACFFSLPPSLPWDSIALDSILRRRQRRFVKKKGGRKREGKDRVNGRSARANDECAPLSGRIYHEWFSCVRVARRRCGGVRGWWMKKKIRGCGWTGREP